MHSPFVYQLFTEVIKPDKQFAIFENIEAIRYEMAASNLEIDFTDFGAGGQKNAFRKRKLSEVVNSAAKKPHVARLLFRLSEFWQAKNIVELGTSLGLSTLYLSGPRRTNKVTTFEGCPNTAKFAAENFQKLGRKDIEIVVGNIDQTLANEIGRIRAIDMAFMDANHRYQPTVNYFNLLAGKATENSLFILDDIHWSLEMEQAWEQIKTDPRVTITVDLFHIGLVFFRKGQAKQHFVLRFA